MGYLGDKGGGGSEAREAPAGHRQLTAMGHSAVCSCPNTVAAQRVA